MNFQQMVHGAADDSAVFDDLYKEYYVRLFRYLYSRVGTKDDIPDLVQNIFLKALGHVSDWKDVAAPQAYLFTIGRNVLIDYYRKKKSLPASTIELEIYEIADEGNTQEETHAHRDAVARGLGELRGAYREVIELRFFAELSYSEIADVLDKREDNVRQLCSRAVKSLGGVLRNMKNKKENKIHEEVLSRIEVGERSEALLAEFSDSQDVRAFIQTIQSLETSRESITPKEEDLRAVLASIRVEVTKDETPRLSLVERYRYVWRVALPVVALAIVLVFVGVAGGPSGPTSIDSVVDAVLEDAALDASYAENDIITKVNGEYDDLDPFAELL